jgi:membrane protease YdiL (CAAX protease family)
VYASSRMTRPWAPLLVFCAIAIGTTCAIAAVTWSMGWTVNSRPWGLLVPFAMWAPAAARVVARRTVDRDFRSTLPLRRWGTTGAAVVLRPLAFPLLVYGVAYAIAWSTGLAQWNPGEGKWTTGSQIAANVIINLALLGIIGTFTAMGEEIGWRGYLQPRLDVAGVRSSLIIVWIVQLAYHLPLMIGAAYVDLGSLPVSFALFAIGDLPFTFIATRESYLARSLWPAVFLHSFHNTISQWLFPKFFTVSGGQIWLHGEDGVLPMAGYAALGLLFVIAMRRRAQSWQAFAHDALAEGGAIVGRGAASRWGGQSAVGPPLPRR